MKTRFHYSLVRGRMTDAQKREFISNKAKELKIANLGEGLNSSVLDDIISALKSVEENLVIHTDEDTIGHINTIKFLKEKQMITRQTFAMVLNSNVDNAVEKLADSMNIKNENKEEFISVIDGWKNETSGDDFDSAEELFDFLRISYL